MKIFQHDLQVTETNSATGSDEIDVQVPANYKGAKKDKNINNWRLTLHFFYKLKDFCCALKDFSCTGHLMQTRSPKAVERFLQDQF